jgi:REP element-mobilizing transposase RayT
MSSTILTQELYFTTSTVIDWMDVFTRPLYKHIILESLEYCQANKGLDLYAWVLMTNHLHMIVARAEHYLYSSARNYAGMEGLLKVIVVK